MRDTKELYQDTVEQIKKIEKRLKDKNLSDYDRTENEKYLKLFKQLVIELEPIINNNMKDYGEIKVYNTFNITGRGLVLCVSMEENGMTGDTIQTGQKVSWNGISYIIRGIESKRTGLGIYGDSIGLLVSDF